MAVTIDDLPWVHRGSSAYLDAAGILPTPDETRAFLSDQSPGKRARLIDAFLIPGWLRYS